MESPAPRSRVLVVLGMHRSGTSALARCLNLLGAGIGERLIPANWGNERGFWEDAEVVAANGDALAALGMTWHDVRPMPADRWWERDALAAARRRLAEVVRGEAARHALWVVKDPRISRLLPLWRVILAEEGVEPLWVLSARHPDEVALSQARRDAFPEAKSNLLWLRHVLEAELHTRGGARAFVAFDALLADPRGVLARVGERLGVRWPTAPDAAAAEMDAFLSRELKHFSVAARPDADSAAAAAWVRDAHAALTAACDADGAAAAAAFDRVRTEMAAADRLYGPELDDLIGQLAETRAAVDSEHAGWQLEIEKVEHGKREHEKTRARLEASEVERAAIEAERAAIQTRWRDAEARAERARAAGEEIHARARDVAARIEAYEGRRIARLIDRLQPRGDLASSIRSAFRQLFDDSRFFAGDLRGYVLAPSESLRRVAALVYPIAVDRPGLAEVWLAAAFDVAPGTGSIVLELLADGGDVLRRAEVAASSATETEPLRFAFAPLPAAPGRVRLRVSARELDAPLRVFEWQRVSLRGVGPRRTRVFVALQFAGAPAAGRV